MGKSAPTPPTPPDPTVVANAQSAADIATATAQQKLNMINSSTPYGTVNYAADPNAPGGYSRSTTFSPSQQGLYDSTTAAEQQALNVAGQQIGRVGTALGQTLTPGQMAMGLNPTQMQTSLGQLPAYQTGFQNQGQLINGVQGGQIQGGVSPTGQQMSVQGGGNIQTGINNPQALYGFNPGGTIQGQIGDNNASGAVNAVSNALYGQATSRLDPQFQQQRQQLQQQLANQGIGINSAAYQNAMDQFGRTQNDAYNQANFSAIGAGANEQNVLWNQALGQGQFANQAQQQQYGQNLGQFNAYNQAAAQNFGQNLQQGQFANNAQLQQFNQNLGQGNFANTAANNLYNQQLSSGQFANQAQAQGFGQGQANATLNNQAQQQGFAQQATQMAQYNDAVNSITQQALASGQFTNQAEAQQFAQQQAAAQFQNTAQQQNLNQQAYIQNEPLNQFNSLMSSSQVQGPQGVQYSPTSVAPTDVLGAYALNSQVAQSNYQAAQQQQNGLLGGLFNLGSSAMMSL